MSKTDELLEELKQRRDEARLKMHLASRELKDEWEELEEKLEDFKSKARLKETGEGVSRALGELGQELADGYRRIRDALRD